MSPLTYGESYTYDTVLPVEADVHTVEQVPGFANVSVWSTCNWSNGKCKITRTQSTVHNFEMLY